jgi:hypothetical protein
VKPVTIELTDFKTKKVVDTLEVGLGCGVVKEVEEDRAVVEGSVWAGG